MVFLSLSKYQVKRRVVPASIGALLADTNMLERIIAQIYGLATEDIDSISVHQETAGDIKGNLSDSARLRVTVELTDGSEAAYNWFVKVRPDNVNSDITQQFNIFKNEIEFYQKIVPEMKAFLLAEGCDPEYTEFEIPEILYAREEGDDGAIIILKDILSEGYSHERDENGDKFLSVEAALAAARSIAKLHAVSVAIQENQQVDLAEEHPTLAESGMLWTQREMTRRLEVMKNSYCDLLSQSSELDSPTLLKRFRRMFDSETRLIELCENRCKSPGPRSTFSIQHGDFHFNNLMFKKTETGQYKVMIVDWQLTYTGKATGDLSYLLLSSLSHQNREDYEEHIKNEYFSVYRATLDKLADLRMSNAEVSTMKEEYTDSLPLSFFFSCGNIMAGEHEDRNVQFSYDMCKEAVMKEII